LLKKVKELLRGLYHGDRPATASDDLTVWFWTVRTSQTGRPGFIQAPEVLFG